MSDSAEAAAPGRLGELLRALILDGGPIGVDRYMALCLSHPVLGYYANREPFGAAGDFTTAPETSQMFGELVGAWVAAVWASMGAPCPLRLVELGPGRGTLMADALRVMGRVPGLVAALDLHLVELSPRLVAAQRAALAGGPPPNWHGTVEAVPPGPAIVIANEFFDALPVRHYVRAGGGWRERLVGLDAGGRLGFGLAPEPEAAIRLEAPDGAVIEVGLAARSLAEGLARRLAGQGGAALVVDYGYERAAYAETLQAVRRHGFADPLAEPGEADLSAHVDFGALGRAAEGAGAAVHGPVAQGEFLRALGLDARADALKARAPGRAAEIDAARERLAGPGPGGMGTLFRALCIAHPALPAPPGFEATPP